MMIPDLPIALVGELNPYGHDSRFALYHLPEGASGDRLRRILGLCVDDYERIPKYNLCTGTWDPIRAHGRALELRQMHRVIVALGRKVAHAFPRAPETFCTREDEYGVVISLPHPSGRNRAWNEPGTWDRARALLRRHHPAIEWGSFAG